ncbi:unnamed protein product [Effrenium voratum]|nr:unnamed protein product [Effrenium voratum]
MWLCFGATSGRAQSKLIKLPKRCAPFTYNWQPWPGRGVCLGACDCNSVQGSFLLACVDDSCKRYMCSLLKGLCLNPQMFCSQSLAAGGCVAATLFSDVTFTHSIRSMPWLPRAVNLKVLGVPQVR